MSTRVGEVLCKQMNMDTGIKVLITLPFCFVSNISNILKHAFGGEFIPN